MLLYRCENLDPVDGNENSGSSVQIDENTHWLCHEEEVAIAFG